MNPLWGMKNRKDGYDIQFFSSGNGQLLANSDASDIAVVTGPPRYDTCMNVTGYSMKLTAYHVTPGVKACVRTSERRYAFLKIKKVSRDRGQIQFDATVWDPPFE
jgi:hypothetical protein